MTLITERMDLDNEYSNDFYNDYIKPKNLVRCNVLALKEYIDDELYNFISDDYLSKLGKKALITSISNTFNYEVLFENLKNYYLDNNFTRNEDEDEEADDDDNKDEKAIEVT